MKSREKELIIPVNNSDKLNNILIFIRYSDIIIFELINLDGHDNLLFFNDKFYFDFYR